MAKKTIKESIKEVVSKKEVKAKTPLEIYEELVAAISESSNPLKLTLLQTLKSIKEEL